MSETPFSSSLLAPVLTALAIIVAVVLYLLQRERREMSYLVSSHYRLLSLEEEESITRDIQILFKSKEVKDPHLVVVQIGNTGNKPIDTKDFSTPLNLNFGDEASVIDYEIIKEETKPPNLYTEALKATSIQGNKISISPILMNAEDRLAIKALVAIFQGLTVEGRILGIKKIRERDTLESHRAVRKVVHIADIVAFGWVIICTLMTSELPEILRTQTVWGGLLYGVPTPLVFLAPAFAYALVRFSYRIIHRSLQKSE